MTKQRIYDLLTVGGREVGDRVGSCVGTVRRAQLHMASPYGTSHLPPSESVAKGVHVSSSSWKALSHTNAELQLLHHCEHVFQLVWATIVQIEALFSQVLMFWVHAYVSHNPVAQTGVQHVRNTI